MARYEATGIIEPALLNQREAVFGDFSSGEDFTTIQDKLVAVRNVFEGLPAHVRNRFDNDPAQLIDFMSDDANVEEAIKLGLAQRKEVTPSAADDSPPRGNPPEGGTPGPGPGSNREDPPRARPEPKTVKTDT